MYFYRLAALVMGLSLLGCASSSLTEITTKERLVTPFAKALKGWTLQESQRPNYWVRLWLAPGQGGSNALRISFSQQQSYEFDAFRETLDTGGRSKCHVFQSAVKPLATKDAMLWQTLCTHGPHTAHVIHLVLQGNEGFYHIQRSWQTAQPQNVLNQWLEALQGTYLCGEGRQACP